MLQINEEFQKLIPALARGEYELLEQSIISDGCRDSIVTWQGVIVDGHNRYQICTDNNIEFSTVEIEFDSEAHARIWMRNHALGQRNLSDWARYEIADGNREDLAKIGKENQGERTDILSTIDKKLPHNTRKEIANDLGWSETKVARADKVKKEAAPETIDKIKSGEMSINQAYKEVAKKESYSEVSKKIQDHEIKPKSEVNEALKKKFDVNFGDVYLINDKHRLIINDSTDVETIKAITGDIDCILTDPPYGINYKAPSGNGLTIRGKRSCITRF